MNTRTNKRKPTDPRRTNTPIGASVLDRENGFVLHCGNESIAEVNWNDVKTVFAYTRFIHGSCLLCLAFVIRNAEGMEDQIIVGDNAKGWECLVADLPTFFPTLDPEWVRKATLSDDVKSAQIAVSNVLPIFNANPVQVWPHQ